MPVPRRPLAVLTALLLSAALLPLGSAAAAEPRDDRLSAGLRAALPASGLAALPRGTTRRAPSSGPAAGGALRTSSAPAPRASLTTAPVSDIQVEFVDGDVRWTDAARRAFLSAVAIWERTVESAVPVLVEATATTFEDPTVLGGAGPFDFLRDDRGTATVVDDVFEPVALANARLRTDTLPGEPDVVAEFDPTASDLYFGTDSNPPGDRIDFRTVVLHELGHGLGLVGTAEVDSSGRATLGDPAANGDQGGRAVVSYDLLTYVGAPGRGGLDGTPLTSLPDGSTELRDALTGGALYWSGQLARTAARGGTVPLHAPTQFVSGTSYGHLDERSFSGEDPDGLMTPFLEPGEALDDPGQVAMGMLADLGFPVPALRGYRYTAVDPVRVLDTRTGTGRGSDTATATVGAGEAVDLQVAGVQGVPGNAVAVVLNVTAVNPSAATDVRVYPTPVVDTGPPGTSALNVPRGRTRANLVTVPIGAEGRVRLRNTSGTVHLVADLAGSYAPGASSSFTAAEPVRVMDTRGPDGRELGVRTGPVYGGEVVDLSVVRNGPVPADATAVALTVTAVGPTADTDVRVYPVPADGGAVPRVSNVNAPRGSTVPNVVVVPLGPGGTVRFRNASGGVHLLADVTGWYEEDAPAGLFRPVGPTRVLDTRRTGTALDAGGTLDLPVAGVARVPSSATAAVLNLTGVGATAVTDVRAYPASADTPPRVSNLNLVPGETAADLVLSRLGAGGLRLRNASGRVDLLADVAGWFGPAA